MYSYRIEQALRAATILHKDQVRKGSIPMPYVSHLFATAMIALDYTKDEDVLIGALLHDTLEDTDYTAAELEDDFGGKVREIVEALSEPQDTDTKEYGWKERKAIYAKQLRKAPQESLLIAAADKIHNMRAMVEEYYDDHGRFLKEFSGDLDDRLVQYQDIANAINRRLKSDILNEFNHVFTEYKNFITDVKNTKESNERY
ncbi:MAG: (p)ppGpp synthase/HD superfamily hydrolase [Patiriisocius sp.]|jgi:(p)ppGpp synthase/HD superfamily hydrolase